MRGRCRKDNNGENDNYYNRKEEVKKMCIDILRQTISEENILNENEMNDACIVVEELNRNGLTVKRIPFVAMKE